MRNSLHARLLFGAGLLAPAATRALAETPPPYTKWVNYKREQRRNHPYPAG